ncbi:hypothetical protein PENTCL1PPCAC_22253 [Pristionchus entomophagus]|uniref:Tubulin-specific chaperone D n=1 Tax=Pristionchus entomophagus TaxID=358040 RepID=A0AAV5TZR8_9BILA|nr:hypothetical protein PENTCL1PPCAC_22253 [Pristionchus entomophagus]
MRDIILPPEASNSPMEEETPTPEDEDVIGCLPRLFASAHKDEVEGILAQLPPLCVPGKEHDLEKAFERYQKLLDLYQEQPSLLDRSIPSLLSTLLSYVDLPKTERTRLDRQSSVAMNFAYHLTKVRGHKVMARQLPHSVQYLAPLISCLEAYDKSESARPEKSMLLLWLTIVAKNPFDLRKFDGAASEGATLRRIFDLAMPYLEAAWNRTHYYASLLLAECLARQDGHILLPTTIDRVIKVIEDTVADVEKEASAKGAAAAAPGSSSIRVSMQMADRIIGPIILLLAIMKKVDRCHLQQYVTRIEQTVKRFFPLHPSDQSLGKKCLVKTIQRLALITLRPKLAKWRYTRGKRRIEENLRAVTGEENGDSPRNGSSRIGKKRKAKQEEEEDKEDEEVEHIEMIQWVIDKLLRALSDPDTEVRWSAAKGLGRIAARLPEDFAAVVVNALLTNNFHRLQGNSSWHGGCLCLAELSRRGCLLPSLLPRAFTIVKQALFFQEPTGRFALGVNVRDAACYVVWAWARAYEASELASHVEEIAASLMCVALFDREVRIRRAASAAFQENVGRQRTFPDGIALITLADYFAVGNRKRCFSQLAYEVSAFSKYTRHLIDHLIVDKMRHWDEMIREQAASSLGRLAHRDGDYMRERMEDTILPGMDAKNVMDRHGFILSAAEVYAGLKETGVVGMEREEERLSSLPSSLISSCSSAGKGVEVLKRAAAISMGRLASVGIPLDERQIGEWLSLLEVLTADDRETTVAVAADSARPFFSRYIDSSPKWSAEAGERARNKMLTTRREGERTGACILAALLRPESIDDKLFETLATIIGSRSETDKLWAAARQASAKAATTAGKNESRTRATVRLLAAGTEDYTTDRRGDIGRMVREESMRGLASLACEGLMNGKELEDALQRMIQQSAEKIGNTRQVACECIISILNSLGDAVPDCEILREVYRDSALFKSDSVLLTLSPLLRSTLFRPHLLAALVLSAGGISEVTTRAATQTITTYLKAASEQDQELFVSLLAEMVSCPMARKSQAALRVLPRLLLECECVERRAEKCAPLQNIMSTLVRITLKSANPSRCRMALETLSVLLSLPEGTKVWRTAADCCLRSLRSPLPAIRRSAAECLYEGLCVSETVDEEALVMLSETTWQDTDDMPGLERTSRLITERILREDTV